MSMEKSDSQKTEELFELYRANYNLLQELNSKKGKSYRNLSPEIRIDGEVMSSSILVSEPFDNSIHTCGKVSYPETLESNTNFGNHWTYLVKLSTEQNEYLVKEFGSIEFDIEVFSNSVKEAKGLWADYLYEVNHRSGKYVPNITGQQGDILQAISSNFVEVLEQIASSKIMKKIGNYDPLERKGIVSDKLFELFLKNYYRCVHFEETKCEICKKNFYPQAHNQWVGRVPPKYCGICLEMCFSSSTDFFRRLGFTEEERKTNAIEGIKIYTNYFGFIPKVGNKKRTVMSQLYRSGIELAELTYALKVSALLPWQDSAKKMFGSWAHLLESAGLLKDRQSGRGGHQSIASDGHHCLSIGERAICEFLTKNGILHDKEPLYPVHHKLNPNGLLRGDFLVDGIIIEFAGMMSNSDYAKRMSNKQQLAKEMGLNWVKLEASTLEDLQSMLISINSQGKDGQP